MEDGLPDMALVYSNGPAYYNFNFGENGNVTRLNLSTLNEETLLDPEFRHPTGAYNDDVTHGGEDVPIYATGPMSHLFHRVHDQTYVPNVIAFAACMNKFQNEPHCQEEQGKIMSSSGL